LKATLEKKHAVFPDEVKLRSCDGSTSKFRMNTGFEEDLLGGKGVKAARISGGEEAYCSVDVANTSKVGCKKKGRLSKILL
jgi:hypothetical protein